MPRMSLWSWITGRSWRDAELASAPPGRAPPREPAAARDGDGLEPLRRALAAVDREAAPSDWAAAVARLGEALIERGRADPGPGGMARLEEAARVYAQAGAEIVRSRDPAVWAYLRAGYGRACLERFFRVGADEWYAAGDEAVQALDDARLALRFEEHPRFVAETQMHLGAATHQVGRLHPGPEHAVHLDYSASCFVSLAKLCRGGELEGLGATSAFNAAQVYATRAERSAPADRGPHLENAAAWLAEARGRLFGAGFLASMDALEAKIAGLRS